ncbi:type IV secretion system DNA-binding domain-containing protein [Massilia sp.]|uniref:type IV secretion system DNA-binding domain-containing protein n=1 Tax=Massilia sp. TaxID=1882437 RepID=UPI00352C4349
MARNIAATNAGVGQASVTTRVKLTVQAAKKCLFFGAVPMFAAPILYWISAATPQEYDVAKIAVQTTFLDEDTPRKWRIRDTDGTRKIISMDVDGGPPAQYIAARDLPKALGPTWQPAISFKRTVWIALTAAAVGYGSVWQLFVYRGRQQQANRRIRGARDIVEPSELNRLVRQRGASDYRLADVVLPKDAPMRGILAIGAQGSGKSVAIHDFMQQVFAKKRKCVIYDNSGEYYRAYFRPGIDMFFNPSFLGSLAWSIFVEMRNRYDANTMAQAFLPPKSSAGAVGANSFFEDAARAVFSVILLRLTERGAVNTKDMARAFLEMPAEEMDVLIQKSVASSAVGGDSKGQRQGVISSIAIYLDGLAAVNEGSWSIAEFLDRDDDARLFLLGTDDTNAMFAPLYRLLLQVAFSTIAARQEIVHYDRYWFFLDELPELGDIKIDHQLATKRKYGVSILAGFQNDSQLVASIGKERAESTMNGFNTVLQLAVNEADAKERAAKRFAKAEVETISQNQAVAVVEQRDGAGLVINEQEKWSIMPATFGELHPCTGFVKLAGDYPPARVDYSAWLRPRLWFFPPRVAAFAERQENPPRDERFRISRQTLPSGESAFDGVKREAELARAEAEKKKKEEQEREKEQSTTQSPTDGVIEVSMTSGATEVATPNPNRELDLGL